MTTAPQGDGIKQGAFAPTRWSVVLAAGRSDTTTGHNALAKLCQMYWYPLYIYIRRRGSSPEDAQDLTQGFFARFLERHWVDRADRERGKFRSFLLTALNGFLSDQWDKGRAAKRGGGAEMLPLDFDTAETRYSREPADWQTPERLYERRWVLTILETVLRRLGEEYGAAGKSALFAALSPALVGDREAQPYAELGAKLGWSESAVKSAAHRLRQDYRQLLRQEIAQTVNGPGEVEEELRHLLRVLSSE